MSSLWKFDPCQLDRLMPNLGFSFSPRPETAVFFERTFHHSKYGLRAVG